MSKQQIFVKHKDEIMLEILRLHRLTFCDDEHRPKIEAEAVNHGKIQGLMWAVGLFDIKKDKDIDPFDQWDNEEKDNKVKKGWTVQDETGKWQEVEPFSYQKTKENE